MDIDGTEIGFITGGLLSVVLGIYLLWWRRLIEDTPRSKIRSIAMGWVELHGKVISKKGHLFTTPFSQKKCVWCKWSVYEDVKRGWKEEMIEIKSGVLEHPFYVKDETSEVLIDPEGIYMDGIKGIQGTHYVIDNLLKKGNYLGHFLEFFKANDISYLTPEGKERKFSVTEQYIGEGDMLYIYGQAEKNPAVPTATSQKNEQNIVIKKPNISYFGEDYKPTKQIVGILIIIAFGAILMALGVGYLMPVRNNSIGGGWMSLREFSPLVVVISIFVIVIIFYLIFIFNSLVRLKNQIVKSWANIDVLLKQRADELPNLVETVKGYMKHEKELLTSITTARSSYLDASTIGDKAKADKQASASVKNLFAIVENYPKLKANENFLKLQKRITGLENEIADRRELYNDSVTIYNTRQDTFPDLILARLMMLKKEQLFNVDAQDSKPVSVSL